MRPAQYLVVVAFGVFDGRQTLLVVAVVEAVADVVAARRADTREDHSFLTQLACKATHCQRARPENTVIKALISLPNTCRLDKTTYKLQLS